MKLIFTLFSLWDCYFTHHLVVVSDYLSSFIWKLALAFGLAIVTNRVHTTPSARYHMVNQFCLTNTIAEYFVRPFLSFKRWLNGFIEKEIIGKVIGKSHHIVTEWVKLLNYHALQEYMTLLLEWLRTPSL